jgi:hypothetical protein
MLIECWFQVRRNSNEILLKYDSCDRKIALFNKCEKNGTDTFFAFLVLPELKGNMKCSSQINYDNVTVVGDLVRTRSGLFRSVDCVLAQITTPRGAGPSGALLGINDPSKNMVGLRYVTAMNAVPTGKYASRAQLENSFIALDAALSSSGEESALPSRSQVLEAKRKSDNEAVAKAQFSKDLARQQKKAPERAAEVFRVDDDDDDDVSESLTAAGTAIKDNKRSKKLGQKTISTKVKPVNRPSADAESLESQSAKRPRGSGGQKSFSKNDELLDGDHDHERKQDRFEQQLNESREQNRLLLKRLEEQGMSIAAAAQAQPTAIQPQPLYAAAAQAGAPPMHAQQQQQAAVAQGPQAQMQPLAQHYAQHYGAAAQAGPPLMYAQQQQQVTLAQGPQAQMQSLVQHYPQHYGAAAQPGPPLMHAQQQQLVAVPQAQMQPMAQHYSQQQSQPGYVHNIQSLPLAYGLPPPPQQSLSPHTPMIHMQQQPQYTQQPSTTVFMAPQSQNAQPPLMCLQTPFQSHSAMQSQPILYMAHASQPQQVLSAVVQQHAPQMQQQSVLYVQAPQQNQQPALYMQLQVQPQQQQHSVLVQHHQLPGIQHLNSQSSVILNQLPLYQS